MRSRPTAHPCFLTSACVAIVMALCPGRATAGEFSVANCQADPLNFSTRAFDEFATRGMKIKRACDPEGPGLRGLITSNVVRGGRVRRGAVAMVTISAPLGTLFTSFRWAGTNRGKVRHSSECCYCLKEQRITARSWPTVGCCFSSRLSHKSPTTNCAPPTI